MLLEWVRNILILVALIAIISRIIILSVGFKLSILQVLVHAIGSDCRRALTLAGRLLVSANARLIASAVAEFPPFWRSILCPRWPQSL